MTKGRKNRNVTHRHNTPLSTCPECGRTVLIGDGVTMTAVDARGHARLVKVHPDCVLSFEQSQRHQQ